MDISSKIIDGGLDDLDYIYDVLNPALTMHNIRTKSIVFVINSSKVIIRKIKLPVLKKKSEIVSMLKYELEQLIPVDLKEYQFKYKIIKINDSDNNYAYYVVYCMPLYLINQYSELAKRLRFSSVIFDVSSNCLNKITTHNLSINKTDISKDVTAIVDISINKMFFSVFNKGVNDFSITMTLNEGNINEMVAEEEAAYTVDCMPDNNIYKYLDEIRKYIRFYQSINYENKINKLYIYGSFDNMDNLLSSVSRYLKMDVDNIKGISNIKFNDCISENNFNINNFFTVVLAAFNDNRDVFFKQEKNDILSKIRRVDFVALIFIIIIAFSFFNFFIVLKGNEFSDMKIFINDSNNIKLNNEIEVLKNETNNLENILHNIELLKTTAAKEDSVRSEIFKEIKYAMPENTIVISISIGRNNAQLNCVSNSMEDVTLFLNNLRNIKFMESIYIPSVEVKQELNGSYSYSVVCALKEVLFVGN